MSRGLLDVFTDASDPAGFFAPKKRQLYNIEDYNTKVEAEQIRGMAKAWQDLIGSRLQDLEDGSDVREAVQRRGLTDIALAQDAPPMVAYGDSTGASLFDRQRQAMSARAKVMSMSDEAGRNAGSKAKMAKTRFFRGVRDSALGNTMSLAGALDEVGKVNQAISDLKRATVSNGLGTVVGGVMGGIGGMGGGGFEGLDWSGFPKMPSIGSLTNPATGGLASISPYNGGWAPQPSLVGGSAPEGWGFTPSLNGI